jgi:hypothetical protein
MALAGNIERGNPGKEQIYIIKKEGLRRFFNWIAALHDSA